MDGSSLERGIGVAVKELVVGVLVNELGVKRLG